MLVIEKDKLFIYDFFYFDFLGRYFQRRKRDILT